MKFLALGQHITFFFGQVALCFWLPLAEEAT